MAKKKKKVKLAGKTSGVGVIETWKIAFLKKKFKTANQVSKFMHSEFPNRGSKIFDYPNVVVGRYNAGLLTKGEPKTKLKAYPKESEVTRGSTSKKKEKNR